MQTKIVHETKCLLRCTKNYKIQGFWILYAEVKSTQFNDIKVQTRIWRRVTNVSLDGVFVLFPIVTESFTSRVLHIIINLVLSVSLSRKKSGQSEAHVCLWVSRVYFSLTLSFSLFLVSLRCSPRMLQEAEKHTDADTFFGGENSLSRSWSPRISYKWNSDVFIFVFLFRSANFKDNSACCYQTFVSIMIFALNTADN